MTKLICTVPDKHGSWCDGIVVKKDIYFCKNVFCRKKYSIEEAKKFEKLKCPPCDTELKKAKEYMCTKPNCKTIFNLVEVEG